jgi:hypothetical protein
LPEDRQEIIEGEEAMIELLKQLAEKYPEKWRIQHELFWSTNANVSLFSMRDIAGQAPWGVWDKMDFVTTEHMDAILAEHGLVMGVTWILDDDGLTTWKGEFGCKEDSQVLEIISREEKRAATEATFQSALEYILKEGK